MNSMHSRMTLILTFSLREKELRVTPWLCKLPLPEGEGWSEGPALNAQKTYRHP